MLIEKQTLAELIHYCCAILVCVLQLFYLLLNYCKLFL